MTHPAEQARKHIMKGLEACQTSPELTHALEKLATHLAKAQGKLYPAAQLPEDSPGSIDMMRRAMDNLARALKILQDLDHSSEAVNTAAGAIAKSLQTLHPVVQSAKQKTSHLSSESSSSSTEFHNVDVNTMLSLNTDHQFYTGFSEDIEEGGIFVATFEPKPIDSQVVVNFRLPGNVAVSAKGKVHFVRNYNPMTPEIPPGMGVRFTDLLPSDKKAIEKYLKSRAPMFYDD